MRIYIYSYLATICTEPLQLGLRCRSCYKQNVSTWY